MTTVRDKLHDRIDRREELADEARKAAREMVRSRLQEALDSEYEDGQPASIEDALMLLASWLAEDLDELTTKAAKEGAKLMLSARGKKKVDEKKGD